MKKTRVVNLLTIFLFGGLACLIVWLVYQGGTYPSGSDTMCHIYKGDILYREILKGNFYPLIDPMWYNGVEMMRYWAPLPVYTLALCQALTGGNMFSGYLLFIGCVFFFGAIVWLIIGKRHNRTGLGIYMGILWFFMPNNLHALFVEGNLPRTLCMVFLPWLVEQIYQYLKEKRWQNLLGVMLCFLPIVLCHLGYAGMILLAVCVFLVLYAFRYGGFRKSFHILVGMVLSILILGLWVYPSLIGGITSTDSSQVMQGFFQDAWVSLNPFHRSMHGVEVAFYFGLAAFVVAVQGLFVGKKKSAVFFACALIIFACTTTAMYPVLSHLPGSQYLWMLRFISIALCMIMFGMMLWDTLKKKWLILGCCLLVLDVLPSLSLVYGSMNGLTVEARMDRAQELTLIDRAQEITTQRLALMDLSTMGATGAFLVSDYGEPVASTFGAGWQSANTANNIMMLNEALEVGRYYYLFDRCLELGNDSVIVQVSHLYRKQEDKGLVENAAKSAGYELVADNGAYQLYHLDTEYEQFGTVTKYKAIAIGEAAAATTMDYPAMEHGDSVNLDDYSYEDLLQYELIYLNGFTYMDKSRAENLVVQLSENGVRVVIEADGMPIDEHTGIQSFLDVVCQPVVFSNGYPLLETVDGVLDLTLFPKGHTSWKAVFLNGLDDSWGKVQEPDGKLDFYGTVKNDNIVMIGLNFSYFYSLTLDEAAGKLLSRAMNIPRNALPEREIVPIEIKYEKDRIIIRSEQDNVNTGVAYHDIFRTNHKIFHRNNLTYVDAGETVIKLSYPYFWEGMLITVVSLLVAGLFLYVVQNLWNKRNVKKVELLEIVRPVKGQKPCFEVAIPPEVKYNIQSVKWYDLAGQELAEEEAFAETAYRLAVVVGVAEEEHFDDVLKVTVNGLKADRIERMEADKIVLVEMTYQTIDPFRFLKQPKDLEGIGDEALVVKWMISKVPKVGYLQMQEGENWIICDTLPREAEQELTMNIYYEKLQECKYRLVYITSDGQTQYSEEFHAVWKEGTRHEDFSDRR